MSDTERLVRVETKLDTLTEHFTNHIKHHWMVTIPLITIVGGLIVALILALCKGH